MVASVVEPEAYARVLLSRLGIKPPVDLDLIALALDVSIRWIDSDAIEGMMQWRPGQLTGQLRGIIGYRALLHDIGRERFTIAHEIGHYLLPGHGATELACRSSDIHSSDDSRPPQEVAANRFAGELLLPTEEIRRILCLRQLSFKTVEFISGEFKTSLTAAAFKCLDVTNEECVLVTSVGGMAKCSRPSKSWRYLVPVKCKLGKGTLASQLFADLTVREKKGVVSAMAWASSGQYMEVGAKLFEDSILQKQYNTVLSLLTAIDPR